MKIETLKHIIAQGEGEALEFKATTGQRQAACRTLCALLNKNGGAVVFGVTPQGRLTGQPTSDKTRRAQSSTTVMGQEEYEAMLAERRGFRSDWELRPNPDLRPDDLDLEEVRRTARRAVRAGRLDDSVDTEDAAALLERMQAQRNGVLLNAAAVLFGKPRLFGYPQLELSKTIESWGRGLDLIARELSRVGLPLPSIRVGNGYVTTTFSRPPASSVAPVTGSDPETIQIDPENASTTGAATDVTTDAAGPSQRGQVNRAKSKGQVGGAKSGVEQVVLALGDGPMSSGEIVAALGKAGLSGQLKRTLKTMLTDGLLAYTIPDKPRSRLQQYRLTAQGRTLQARLAAEQQDEHHT